MRIKFDDRKMRMLLYDKKLTQTKVSELSKVSRPIVAKAFSGKTCSEETGRKICTALGIDIHDYATFNRF